MDLVSIDGSLSEGGGQVLRSALTLSAMTGRGFCMEKIRAQRVRPGLRPQHLAVVRSAALACGAEVRGAFDGSPDLRFLPQGPVAGEFVFEIGTAGAATLVLQAVAPILALAEEKSRVSVLGGTHLPRSPSFEFVARNWVPIVQRLGLRVSPTLVRAGFGPKADGRIDCAIQNWHRPATLDLSRRGRLLAVRGVAASARVRGDVAARAAEAARHLLWEARRIESDWEVMEANASAPGSFLHVEGIFELGHAAFSALGERGVPPERLGARAARWLLRFIDDEAAVVDPWLADQLVVPLAAARGGGRVVTSEVSSHLERTAAVARLFGVPAETWGRKGGPGGVEVGRW